MTAGLTPFNMTIRASDNTGDYAPLWEAFATTEFLVPVFAHINGNKTSYEIAIRPSGQGVPIVRISEHAELLVADAEHEVAARRMTGTALVMDLVPGTAVVIALPSGEDFRIPEAAAQLLRNRAEPS